MSETAAPPKMGFLHIGLWTVQVLLAIFFGLAGYSKAFGAIADLTVQMNFVQYTPEWLVRFIGFAELAGMLGMILPALTRILPLLTPLAAAGFALIQILAMMVHIALGEWMILPVNVALLALSLFVFWGRWTARPIPPSF